VLVAGHERGGQRRGDAAAAAIICRVFLASSVPPHQNQLRGFSTPSLGPQSNFLLPGTVRLTPLLAASAFVALSATVASGQVGSCVAPSRFECVVLQGQESDGDQLRQWVRGVVLWRRTLEDRPRVPGDSLAEQQNVERFLAKAQWTSASARQFVGGGLGLYSWTAYFTRSNAARHVDSLIVRDSAFVLPARDSTIVVLVDHVDGEMIAPRIVYALVLPGALPPAIITKMSVGPASVSTVDGHDPEMRMFAALRSHPAIAAYLARAP
ncbi:MAG: hypothetical protein K8S21_10320, partial [Gemmatimonadetes bacterium]|nr:hypothetical protein [Gemmatimonadota bacterium]